MATIAFSMILNFSGLALVGPTEYLQRHAIGRIKDIRKFFEAIDVIENPQVCPSAAANLRWLCEARVYHALLPTRWARSYIGTI